MSQPNLMVLGVSDFSRQLQTGDPEYTARILRGAGLLTDPKRPHSTNE